MMTTLQVELACGLKVKVEHEVKTFADFRKLVKKADTKMASLCREFAELSDDKVKTARVSGAGPKQESAAA